MPTKTTTNRAANQAADQAWSIPEKDREKIVAMLRKSYNMELETVCNYLTNSVHLDGMLAMEVKESLGEDVQAELKHAERIAMRIKILGGEIPGSQSLEMEQTSLQPPADTVDILSVIKGVIEAEEGAIQQYQRIIEATDDNLDPVTQDLCIELKGEEEEHRRQFVGFLREYEAMQRMFKGK